tara:strand:+ start:43 stop:1032 length:990 start_codon:yes stop_codon:yes gene_type:complete
MKRLLDFLAKTFYVPSVRLKGIRWPTITVPSVFIRLPRLGRWSPSVSLPSISFNLNGLRFPLSASKAVGTTLAISLIVGAFSLYFGISGVQGAPSWPAPALYTTEHLGSNDTLKTGVDWDTTFTDTTPADTRESVSMTLAINLSGRAGDLKFTDLDVGAPVGTQNITHSIKISGDSTNNKYLACDTITLTGLSAPQLTLANSEIHTLIVKDTQADGTSIHAALDDVSDIEMQSLRGTYSVDEVKGSTFDRLLIQNVATKEASCRNLELTSISAYGFPVLVSYVKVGTMTIQGRFGKGDGFLSPDLNIENSVKVASLQILNTQESRVDVR